MKMRTKIISFVAVIAAASSAVVYAKTMTTCMAR